MRIDVFSFQSVTQVQLLFGELVFLFPIRIIYSPGININISFLSQINTTHQH